MVDENPGAKYTRREGGKAVSVGVCAACKQPIDIGQKAWKGQYGRYHASCPATKDEQIADLKRQLAEAKAGWDNCIADLRTAADICRNVERQNSALQQEIDLRVEQGRALNEDKEQFKRQNSALVQERDNALMANERDRRALWGIVRAIDEEITGRMWIIEGRGPYEWDDDRYRQEFGWAVKAVQAKLEPLKKIAHDLKDSPATEAGVDVVRKLESAERQNAALLKIVEAVESAPTECPHDEESWYCVCCESDYKERIAAALTEYRKQYAAIRSAEAGKEAANPVRNRLEPGRKCIDCGDGPCDMNCGPAEARKEKR